MASPTQTEEDLARKHPYKLVTIVFSHYNERARWAMDYLKVPYMEWAYMPGMHRLGLARAGAKPGKADETGSPTSVPVVQTPDGAWLTSSGEILDHCSNHFGTPVTTLYPPEHEAEIRKWEKLFHDELGVATRLVVYRETFFGTKKFRRDLFKKNLPTLQKWIGIASLPLIKSAIVKTFGATEAGANEKLTTCRGIFSQVTEQLQKNGGKYIVGDRFTAADLTFACMASPILGACPNYGAYVPPAADGTSWWQDLTSEFRNSPAGQHALMCFEKHHGERQIPLPRRFF